jgi:hypothetical protein
LFLLATSSSTSPNSVAEKTPNVNPITLFVIIVATRNPAPPPYPVRGKLCPPPFEEGKSGWD